ncbi:MAG: M13 family metallopeptidase [Peptococcaceae bacterium]|nr:M13 family metallopeptidase [Peptococcaceae bacterium]
MIPRKILAAALTAALLLTGCGTAATDQSSSSAPKATKTTSDTATPALVDNFYEAAGHDELTTWTIDDDASSNSYFLQMDITGRDRLTALIKKAADAKDTAPDSDGDRVAALYLTGQDEAARDAGGMGDLSSLVTAFGDATSVAELVSLCAQYNRDYYGCVIFPGFQLEADPDDASQQVIYQFGADTGLSREEWLADDDDSKALRSYFQDHLQTLFAAGGASDKDAAAKAKNVCAMMKELATAGLSVSEQYDPEKTTNRYTVTSLAEDFPRLFAADDLQGIWGFNPEDAIIVTDVGVLEKFSDYLTEDNLPLLRDYATAIVYNDWAPFATTAMRDADAAYNQKINGQTAPTPAEESLIKQIKETLPFECGRLYTDAYVTDATKEDVTNIIGEVIDVYREQLRANDWLSDATKEKAIEKLNFVGINVAYPDTWPQDGYALNLARPDADGLYINNVLAAYRAKSAALYTDRHSPVDKSQWYESPQTVNAYYDPARNGIFILAGILQAPFYDPEASREENIAGIGHVIAHELSHAFDDNGAQYDKDGNLSDWWTAEDKSAFKERSQKVIDYYNDMGERFERVNGEQTVSENIADLGAMAAVVRLAENENLDLDKLMTHYAKSWVEIVRPEYATQIYLTDVHAPAEDRVNASLAATDAFYTTYDVQSGDGMYVAPEDRPKIW